MARGIVVLAATLAVAGGFAAAEAGGQTFDRRGEAHGPRVFLGGDFAVADPVGDFGRVVDRVGVGFSVYARVAADDAGIFSLRMTGGFMQYGHERSRVCLAGCRVQADLTTSNDILFLDFGPELGIDLGGVRPYVGVGGGFSYFVTSSSLDDVYDDVDGNGYFRTDNFDDLVYAWRARGGVQVRLSRGSTPVYLDLGAVYHGNGLAEYLTEGDIVDNPDGSVTVFPNFTKTDLVSFQLGVSVGLGGGNDNGRPSRPRRHGR